MSRSLTVLVCHFHGTKYTLNVNLRGSDLPQLQEGRGELVSDEAAGVGVTVLSVSCYKRDV